MSRLYPCVYCTEDGYCKKYSDDEVTSWCVQSPCKDEKPSNADRIRSMTDEELARLFADENCGYCRIHDFCFAKGCQIDCEDVWLGWLKEESK